jgi:hypothetical protein
LMGVIPREAMDLIINPQQQMLMVIGLTH